eukprot:Clim_evm2s83 gene=Clim_evmTU2s83
MPVTKEARKHQPRPLQNPYQVPNDFTAAHVDFLAKDVEIKIYPSFSSKKIQLLSTEIPQFRASVPAKVPLWLALQLKSNQKCKIQAPEWMTVEQLRHYFDKEKEKELLQPIPEHLFEVAQMLINAAPEDIEDLHAIKVALQNLREVRAHKLFEQTTTLTRFISEADQGVMGGDLGLECVTLGEINVVRNLFLQGKNMHYVLQRAHPTKETQT